jgi:aspartate/glutamate racemase
LEDTQKLEEWNILEHILISKGARTIVSACTDISFFLIQAKIKSKIEYFDSMEILAEKTVEFYSKL